MSLSTITNHVLEMLLENWGLFVTTGNWGPKVATECGSMERIWNSDKSRYVWDGEAKALAKAANDTLGALLDKIICAAPIDYVRPLLFFYGHNQQPFQFAGLMRVSQSMAASLLVSAKAFVKQTLESMGYE